MEYYARKKTNSDEYYKKIVDETSKKYATDLSTVSVNAFFDKANKYFASAEDDRKSTGYSTASKNAADRRKQAQELRMEALGVDRYLDINKSTMDESTYKTLKQYVSEIGYETAKVTDAFDTAEDYYSQFSDREKFNDYREGLRQNAWLDKYQNKSYTDLNILANKMEDGDEKNWVKKYATSKYTPEEGYMELSRLENALEEYKYLDRTRVGKNPNERLSDLINRYGSIKNLEALVTETRQRNTLYDREIEREKMTSVGDRESENYDPEFDYWAKSRTAAPTRQDIENYDIMMDNSTWQVANDGRMYDAFGNEIDTTKRDENGNVVHPAAGSVNTSDRLGIYFAAKNDTTDYSVAEHSWGTVDQILAEGDSRHWDRLSEDQINTYYYYLNKQGADAANRYLDLIQDTVNKELGEEIYSEMQDSNALKLLFGAKAGISQFESQMGGFGRQLRGETDYVAPSAEEYASANIRENTDGLMGVAYDAVSTISNMAPSFLVGTLANAFVPGAGFVGSLVMGAGASGGAYDQLINEGYTVEQARTYGTMVGAAEAALNLLLGGISELGGGLLTKGLTRAMSAADNALLKLVGQAGDTAIGRILSNMISEGTEEGLQEILGTWLKNLITHSEENVNWEEVAYSTLLGALTGGVFEGTSVGVNALQTNALRKDVGKTIMAADGGVDALKALALDVSGAGSKLVNQAEKVTGETAVGKNLTGKVVAAAKNSANQKRIGKLYEGVRSEVSAQNRADIAKLLGEKGFSSTSAKNIAEAIAARINGDETNKFQDMVLDEVKDNSAVNEVVKTVLTDEASLVSKRTTDLDLYSRGVAVGKGIAPTKTERPDYDVSEDGKTILHNTDGTAREVEVKKVSNIENGKVKLELNDGTVVDADQVSFASTGEAWTYSVLAEIGATAEEANDILSFYDGSTDIDRVAYARGVQEAYRYGTIGVPAGQISQTGFAARMSDSAMKYAYNVGRKQSVIKAGQAQNKLANRVIGKGQYYNKFTQERNGVHYDDVDITTEKLNAHQKTGIQLAEFLAAIGMNVHVYKSEKVNGQYVGDNGTYYGKDGSIHIDLMSGSSGQGYVGYTISHEFTHFIKDWSPEKFKVFADALFEEMGKSEVEVNKMVAATLARIKSMKEYKNKTEDQLWDIAYDEVVAEMCETMLTDTDAAVRIAENLKKTDSELLNKIIEFFNNMLTKLKGLLKVNVAYKNATPDSYIASQARETIQKVERLRDLYAEAAAGAVQSFNAAKENTSEYAESSMSNEEAFEDSQYAVLNQIRPPYSDGSKAFNTFTENLDADAKKTFDLFYGFYQKSRITNTMSVTGKRVKAVNISSLYLLAQDWNDMLAKEPKWATAAKELADFLPADVRKRMNMNEDGTLNPTMLEKEFKMPSSMAQRLVDALQVEAIEATYRMGNKEITLPEGKARQSVGGEAYRRAIIDETRKLFAEGKLKQVSIGTMSKDRWGSLGFLAANGKTGASGDFTTVCPQMMFNRGCWYCYRRAAMEKGVNNKLVAQSVWYTGEILRIKDSDITALNRNGGLRIQSFGDWMPHFSAMLADVLYDAEQRGLQVKIITKEPSMINYIAALREQGVGKNLYFNLSADYTIERGPAKQAMTADSLDAVNPERPFMRYDNSFWWKRAMTVEEAAKYREKYPWVNVRIVATTQEEFIRGLKDPKVDVVTGYHGNIREYERVDSATGEHKVQVEALGDAGMPRFAFNPMTNSWTIEYEGKTSTHKKLAEAIAANNLQMEYYTKTCCITGRCATCQGKCGALARDFNVKNATNRDAESVAYWQREMQYGIEPEFGDMTTQGEVRYAKRNTSNDEDFDYSALNWAIDSGIINKKDLAIFERTINNEIYRGAEPLSANGEYIIDTGRCLMFTDGNFRRPTLSQVIEFESEYETVTDNAKRRIINEAEATGKVHQSLQIIAAVFGQEFVRRHVPANGSAYAKQNGRRKGSNGSRINQTARSLKDRLGENGLDHLLEDTGSFADVAYMKAVKRGDMVTAQEMVNEAAKLYGYTEEVFHGMGNRHNVYQSGRGQYGDGVYFTYDQPTARGYGKVVDHLFVKIGRIANYDDAYRALGKTDDQSLDDFANTLGFPSFDEMIDDWDNDPTNVESNTDLIDILMDRGFEGFIDDGNSGFVLWDREGIEYRIKSADPVTYDDDGNVIPLSKRFDPTNEDIRYSTRNEITIEKPSDNKYIRMVENGATHIGEYDVVPKSKEPKKTILAWKALVVKPGAKNNPKDKSYGNMYPPQVHQVASTPYGVWLYANEAPKKLDKDGNPVLTKFGRPKVKEGMTYRPAWHFGDAPYASQFKTTHGFFDDNGVRRFYMAESKGILVWALCEMAADENYQDEADMAGHVGEDRMWDEQQASLWYMPENGYYKYMTNRVDPNSVTWYLSDKMRIVQTITDTEMRDILNWIKEDGSTDLEFNYPLRLDGKDVNPSDYGIPVGNVVGDGIDYVEKWKNQFREIALNGDIDITQSHFYYVPSAASSYGDYETVSFSKEVDDHSQELLKTKKDAQILTVNPASSSTATKEFETSSGVKVKEAKSKAGRMKIIEAAKNLGYDIVEFTKVNDNLGADVVIVNPNAVIRNYKFNNVSERHGKTDAVRYSSRVKVDTTGMDEDAKKIIRKLEMISSFSKYDSGKYASYSAERMEREIRNSISTTRMDYAKSYIAWIRPDDFLYATTTSEQIRSKIDAEAGELDLERLSKETQPIHLTVDFENGKVVGHEGRHRMTALAKAGVEKVAVIIDAWNDDRYNTKPISMMDINGQEFGKYHTGTGFYAHDMLPISKRYADAVRQLFSDVSGSVRFSERTEDSVSNRSLLANALESTTQHEVEKTRLQEYKDKIAAMDAEEQKLSDINAQIKEISFSKGPRDKAKLAELQEEKTKIQNRINTYDKQLLRLESTKVLQNVLTREKQKAYKRAEARGQEALEAYKKAADKRYENFVNKQEEKRKNAVEARNRTEIRHKIQRVVKELNDLLLNESKTRHVPDNLKKAVAGALSILNMDTVKAEERAAKYVNLLAKERAKAEPDQDKIDAYTSTMESILRRGEKMGQQLKELRDAYEEIKTSSDPDIALGYDEVIAGAINELSQTIGDTSIMDMSVEQLSDVYDVYKMVLTRVRDANKAMAENIKETITKLASNVITEVRAVGGQRKMRASALDPAMKFMWNNLKPVYAMEYIGSSTLTHVYNNVRAGEDVWAKDVVEARAYYLDKAKKYGYNKWDLEKKYRFTSDSDLEFDLTLEQMLSLYAYSKREQAADHLRLGGFVFDSNIETTKEKGGIIKYKVNTADAHQITPEILTEIIGKLTSEQLGFVDEMQAYLSTVMGAKGNEVTSKMYGVKLFKEKNYFPLKSASQFMFEQNQVAGEVRIKNSGFTNKVVAKANNPIILSNFMDVWSNHVNDMSMYHAFTLPLEDFNRVFNFDSPKKEGIPAQSVKGTIQNAYTPAAVHYVKQLITDLNGGARTDPATGPLNWLMGKFKKGAVFASASVVIQQPSAIARAAALIDTKYFIGPKIDQKKHKAAWEEVKKYAPVAIIKEMGYFDTNMGKSTQDYIQGEEYETFKDQFKAFFTDSDFRDEVLSKAPALADELAWVGIWEAVKRETKAKYPGMDVKGDPFLKLAGSRFTEVITKTQVYDSVLSRSANMRSKDTGMKMATAFMAEPTTSINMITDALLKGKRGNRKYARQAIGSVIVSMLLNSMLVSFVYAARDDDDDQTYLEKYLESLVGSAIDGLNPATYIPFIKDIVSIVKGYDVERSDMAVISDLYNAFTKLKSDKVSAWRKVEDFAGSIAQIFGLPVKNIMRDVRGFYQTFFPAKKQEATWAGAGYAALSGIGKDVSDQEQLYRAYVNGDVEHLARVEGRYTTKKKAYTAMRSAIKDHYLAGDIDDATAINYMVKYCEDDEDDAYWKLEEWRHNAQFEEDFGKYNEFYTAVQTGKDLKATIKKYTDNGVTEETLRSQITDEFKDDYIKMSNAERANIKGYLLNAMTVLGNTRKEAEDKIKDWEFEAANGFSYNNRRKEYLEGDITREQLENALVDYGGLDEEEVEEYFDDVLFEAEYGFAYNNTGKLYKDGELTRDEAYKIFTTQGEMSDEKANIKLKSLDFEIEHGYSYEEKRNKFLDGEITGSELKQYIMSVEGKTDEEASSAIVSYVRDAYSDGEVDKTFALNAMTNYASVDREDAESKLRYIDIKKQYPDTYVDDAWVEEYYEEIESSGMAMDVFFEYRNQVKGITGKGKKENRLAVINSMPISNAQKDALYYAEGWAKSKIYEAPWH